MLGRNAAPAVRGQRSKGLLEQLLEDGMLRQEWVAADGTYCIETRIFFDIETAWLFRCAVRHDGNELSTPPWQPRLKNSTAAVAGQDDTPELRLQLARSALECHLSVNRQVTSRLESHGSLTASTTHRFRRPIPRRAMAFAAVGLLIVLVGGWLVHRLAGPVDVLGNAPATQLTESTPETPDLVVVSEDPTGAAPMPTETVASRAKPPSPKVSSTLDTDVTPPDNGSPPPPPKPRVVARPSTPEQRFRRRATNIRPRDARIFALGSGVRPYPDSPLRLSSGTHRPPLVCMTSATFRGDTDLSFSFQLASKRAVYVAHHRQVKRPPAWLGEFSSTATTWTAVEPDGGRELHFDVYRREFPQGSVSLGANTGAKRLARSVRSVLRNKKLAMYWVCLEDTPE